MASGNFNLTRTSGSTYINYRVEWNSTSNGATANSSNMNVWVYANKSTASTAATRGSVTTTVNVGGTTQTESNLQVSISPGAEVLIFAKGYVVPHNDDGTKSVNISVNVGGNVLGASGSATVTLDSIGRYAMVTSVPSSFTDEDNPTITYKNSLGNSVQKVEACISLTGAVDDVPYREISKTGTSYTFNLTDEERMALINGVPSDTDTRTVAFFLRTTTSDGTRYWHNKITTFKAKDIFPEADIYIYEMNPRITELVGDSGYFVPSGSDIGYSVEATAKKGAYVEKYEVTYGDYKGTTGEGVIPKAKPKNFRETGIQFKITDTRGRSLTEIKTPNMLPNYEAPNCTIVTNSLVTSSGGVFLGVYGVFYDGWFDGTTNGSKGGLKNQLTLQTRYKLDEADAEYSEWEEAYLETDIVYDEYWPGSYSATVGITGLDYTATYVVQIRAMDLVGYGDPALASEEYTVRMIPVFDWSKTDFAVNVPITLKQSIDMSDPYTDDWPLGAMEYIQNVRGTSYGLAIGEGLMEKCYEIDPAPTDFQYDLSASGNNIYLRSYHDVCIIPQNGDFYPDGLYPMSDYIIDYGDDGAYAWRKWRSGKMEAWRSASSKQTLNITSQHGGWYYGEATLGTTNNASQFTAVENVQLTINKAGATGIFSPVVTSATVSGGKVTVNYLAYSPVSVASVAILPNIHIIGRWK